MSQLDERATYTIRVQGCVEQALIDWFGPVSMTTAPATDGPAVTTLATTLADQTALVGLVRHLHALGIVILAVERTVDSGSSGAPQ
ncbi:MAG: hypothetical protein M9936_03845 [Caldilinea sp.]|nr:hypothetical protein [Caldilinea sp.]MCB0066177.1 hypothetical protein [Caldilineaceae bacterium]MCB0038858.1 hypothetical protein [Caldilinea sp.]MCB0050728.1 hypothetical protein [Caldilinea sp.]MCB0151464.1 hypothetical protein [Caldilineaceae bacterium]